MRGAVADAARLVLRARVPVPQVSEPTLGREQYRRQTWSELLAEGAVAQRRITAGEVAAALGTTPEGAPDGVYADIYAALLTPAALGGSLIGLNRYNSTCGAFRWARR